MHLLITVGFTCRIWKSIRQARLTLVQKFRTQYTDNSNNVNIYLKVDSIVCEKYFVFSSNNAIFVKKLI
jgi:hypothetical protein